VVQIEEKLAGLADEEGGEVGTHLENARESLRRYRETHEAGE
jgi:hypothetical protein